MWRILKLPLHGHSPTVFRLQVHLPGQHLVTIKKGTTLKKAVDKNSDSMLMAYFKLNAADSNAKKYTYYNLPEYYTYDHSTRSWHPRLQGDAISRIYTVHPKDGERYMLRVLLMHVPGARSFEELRTYQGRTYASFWAAAQARGLLKDDAEWINCLEEADKLQHPRHLRYLFAMILICCAPSDPKRLWSLFADSLSADFLYKAKKSCLYSASDDQAEIDAKYNALHHLNTLLLDMESSLDKYPTLPQQTKTNIIDLPTDYHNDQERTHHEPSILEYAQLATTHMAQLTEEQKTIFNIIVATISNHTKERLFFIDGPGGTGKTFLYNTLIEYTRGHLKKPAVVVASSGIASIILHQGHTAHSGFGIPLAVDKHTYCNLTKRCLLGKAIIDASIIFWDEEPMLHRKVFECVDRSFRHLMDNPNTPFGGKLIVFGGDFRQTLPIVPHGTQLDIINSSMKNSTDIWSHMTIFKLTKNLRIGDNPKHQAYVNYLLKVGDGTQQTYSDGIHHDYIEIPEEVILQPTGENTDDNFEKQLIRAIFPNIEAPTFNLDTLSDRAILCPLNVDVNRINDLATNMFHSDHSKTYTNIDYTDINPDDAVHFTPEFLNTLDDNGLPQHTITLKIGQPIILLRNISTKRGMCNGTRLQVTKLGDYIIEARIIAGSFTDNIVLIPLIPLSSKDDGTTPIKFTRLQFPIRPAFALTINKAQGQTLTTTGVYLHQPVFSHGQLYVALSRCSNPDNLKVLILNAPTILRPSNTPTTPFTIANGKYTRNIVFKAAL